PTQDLVQDVVIPQNGSSSIINLRQLYNLSEYSTFSVTNDVNTSASVETSFLEKGFLKVKGGETGKASFTITIDDNGDIFEDSFNVTVVPAEPTGKINIGNLVTYMTDYSEDFTTATQVKQLLTSISPSLVDENTGEGATNILKKPFPDFTLNKNSNFSINNVMDVYEYFKQRNVEDSLTFYVFSSDPNIIDIKNNDGVWQVSTTNQAGSADITVVAVNDSGDIGYDTFRATVLADNQAPVISKSVYNKYHISDGGNYELDLNQYFSDSLGEHLNFNLVVASGSTSTFDVPISGSKLYLNSDMNYMTDIVGVKATDTANQMVSQQFTVTGSTYNPFSIQQLFVGSTLELNLTDAFETTAPLNYSFDFVDGFNNNTVTVSKEVYNSQNYLKLSNIVNYPSSSSNLKINAVNPTTNEVFTDNMFMFQTFFEGGFNMESIFPNENGKEQYIQVFSSNSSMPIISEGNFYFINGSGSTTITIDVDHGKKILTVPYTT
ncbi:hypothetical protein AB4Z22_28935, partial [Paenibacillus sp. TAF58]